MHYSKIEIKTIGETPSMTTEVLIDGKEIHGIRSLSYENNAWDKVPTLTLELNALDVSIDSDCVNLEIGKMGSVSKLIFEDGETATFRQYSN